MAVRLRNRNTQKRRDLFVSADSGYGMVWYDYGYGIIPTILIDRKCWIPSRRLASFCCFSFVFSPCLVIRQYLRPAVLIFGPLACYCK